MTSHCEQIRSLLTGWLKSRLDATAFAWVQDRQTVVHSGDKRGFYLAFGLTPRKVGKADLALTAQDLAAAEQVRPGWDPRGWSVDQAVRSLFVLSLPEQQPEALVGTLDQLFGTGEVGELVALYQTLPLLPYPSHHILRAAEGIRTNIKAVFCAVAHRNPFPAEQFSEDQWNQMVLKCQFIGVPLAPIVGLDRRANAPLASMVMDFIEERQAAKRTVTPDIWRCVGRHADSRILNELKRMIGSESPVDRQAAALALNDSVDPAAEQILAAVPALAKEVKQGTLNWSNIDATN